VTSGTDRGQRARSPSRRSSWRRWRWGSRRGAEPDAQVRVGIPAARLLAWSLSPSPDDALAVNGLRMIHLEGLGPEGAQLPVSVRGPAPLPIELRAIAREPARDDAVQEVLRRLPPWTTSSATTIRLNRRDL
jgi:hypothetical protein